MFEDGRKVPVSAAGLGPSSLAIPSSNHKVSSCGGLSLLDLPAEILFVILHQLPDFKSVLRFQVVMADYDYLGSVTIHYFEKSHSRL